MNKHIYLLIIFLAGLLTSCGSAVSVLSFDQLHPAEISIPSEIRHVGVVNNMVPRANEPSNDLILGIFQGEGTACSEALAANLADSKFFDQIIICDSALQSKVADYSVDPKLSADKVNQLTTDLGVDLLISLEALWIETSKKQILYPGWEAPIPALQATVKSLVRVYLPGRLQPLYSITPTDSVYCDLAGAISEKNIVEEATKMVANKISNYLVPTWKPIDRVYYSGGSVEMRDAVICIQEGDWQAAQDCWKLLYDRLRKGAMKARAAYNIALSFEMLGNVEEAMEWLKKSGEYVTSKSQEEQLVNLYSQELRSRMQQMISLKSQMARFNENL